jgi:hypothetical protein
MIGAEDFTVTAILASLQGVRIEMTPKGFRLSKEGYTPLVISYDEFIHTMFKRDIFRAALRTMRRVKP